MAFVERSDWLNDIKVVDDILACHGVWIRSSDLSVAIASPAKKKQQPQAQKALKQSQTSLGRARGGRNGELSKRENPPKGLHGFGSSAIARRFSALPRKRARSRPQDGKNLLLFGFFHDANPSDSALNQNYRDVVRIRGLEAQGYKVFTMDDNHPQELGTEGRHFTGNWGRGGVVGDMLNRWEGTCFEACALDYFYLPGPVYLERYLPPALFTHVLPNMRGVFGISTFFLPNDPRGFAISRVESAASQLQEAGLSWTLIPRSEARRNPLWEVSQRKDVDAELRTLPNPRYHGNQEIYVDATHPFILIHLLEESSHLIEK